MARASSKRVIYTAIVDNLLVAATELAAVGFSDGADRGPTTTASSPIFR
jgi:hypothetical protein